jgi:hypothetical protein
MATVVQGCRGEDGWGTGSETISHQPSVTRLAAMPARVRPCDSDLYHVAILPRLPRDSLNLIRQVQGEKAPFRSAGLVTPTCEHVNNRTIHLFSPIPCLGRNILCGIPPRMNRVLGGAWGMHRFADAQSRDSVDIAACKRDDYHELILLMVPILLVHHLRGRVLYSLPAHYTLVSGKNCHALRCWPNLLATMMLLLLHRVHLVLTVGMTAVASSHRNPRLSSLSDCP